MIFNWPVPLMPIQLLWINLITDSFPAFALGLEKGEKDIMTYKPRDPNEPIVDDSMKIALIFQSIGLTIAVLVSYRLGFIFAKERENAVVIARTFCFITLILGELLRAYSARSEVKQIYKINIFSNKYLNYSVFVAIVLLLIVVYVPFLQPIFKTTNLSSVEFIVATGLSIVPIIFGEVSKTLKHYRN
jgi:Ca2+-transporting ATPase